ncbi:MAG: prolyl oligopeptidase family protein [Fidelibacterota bacterium]
MKQKTLFVTVLVLLAGCYLIPSGTGSISYPETRKEAVTDNYFGTDVPDPYRWLEDDRSEETAKWVQEQNNLTFSYLEKIPFRDSLKQRLETLWNYPRYSPPFKAGKRYFFYKNDGLQNQSVLYVQETLDSPADVLIDPNTLSEDGTVALAGTYFSPDGRYMGYALSTAGSDWREFRVLDIESRTLLDDHIQWVKFSGMAWADNGFYYSRLPEPGQGDELTAANENMKIYFHELGTNQAADTLVYEDPEHPKIGNYVSVTDDGRYLILYRSRGTHGTALMFKDRTVSDEGWKTLIDNFDYEHSVIDNDGEYLLLLTTLEAPNQRVVRVDPQKPEPDNWQTLIPESEHTLRNLSAVGGKLVANYLQDASTRIKIFSRAGRFEKEIPLPGIGSASGFSGKPNDMETFYSFTSFISPGTIYRYDFQTNTSSVFRKSEIDFNPTEYGVRQVFYPSKDGTRIPMFIVHKKDLKKDGNNPTLLYGYGGFNISITPRFSVSNIVFLERGGVYAVANLRGGGEYGENWHEAGMLFKKQNVFDDFIAAGEYLIANGYTLPEHLAIKGGSNGGLLVGAVVNQRPDLFAVAIPQVGVMDMLRYHTFTIGYAWAVEYGSSDTEENFQNLFRYSPLHNIRDDVSYPAILVTTADHDDRVVPAHSFKYIATLQEKQEKYTAPKLIRIETKAGHGAGKPTSKRIAEQADIWAFVLQNT